MRANHMTEVASTFPYGACECRHEDCPCYVVAGPAAFVVTRDGKALRVCTRCDLSSDRATRRLLVKGTDALEPFHEWDSLGAFCIVFAVAEAIAPASDTV